MGAKPFQLSKSYSIPGSGRSPGVGNGNPLQYSCLKNSMKRGAWWVTVHGVAESDTSYTHTHTRYWKMRKGLPCSPVVGTGLLAFPAGGRALMPGWESSAC